MVLSLMILSSAAGSPAGQGCRWWGKGTTMTHGSVLGSPSDKTSEMVVHTVWGDYLVHPYLSDRLWAANDEL